MRLPWELQVDRIVVERIDHVTVNVTDVGRAKKFYGDLLGLQEIARPASFTFPGAWYRIGTTDLHLVGRGRGRAGMDAESSRHFAVWTADVRAAARVLEAASREVAWDRTKIPGIDRFFTSDPDGNRIEIQGDDGTASR